MSKTTITVATSFAVAAMSASDARQYGDELLDCQSRL